ncbi:MAG: hypothetical protein KDI27_02900 [Gammaproteobacteria bacterium]|nr:hypothetical protein [Gammaproteobacteria bacterium]MCP5418697.1 hypothetical protein [Chromatiaceae bacterium]
MKKREKKSDECSLDQKQFPVDTLGIPILVDVVSNADTKELQNGRADEGNHSQANREADESHATAGAIGLEFDRLCEQISDELADEIVTRIKPLVRKKVRAVLKTYRTDLQQLTDSEKPLSK